MRNVFFLVFTLSVEGKIGCSISSFSFCNNNFKIFFYYDFTKIKKKNFMNLLNPKEFDRCRQ